MQPLKIKIPRKGTLALINNGGKIEFTDPIRRVLLDLLGAPVRLFWLDGTMWKQRDYYYETLGQIPDVGLGEVTHGFASMCKRRTDREWEEIYTKVRAANFIYLSGGRTDNVRGSLIKDPIWKAVRGVLADGGVVAGCDGGASACGVAASLVHGESMKRWEFGFVEDGWIDTPYQHPWETRKQESKTNPENLTRVEIEADTALVCHGGHMQIVGNGGVTVIPGEDALNRLIPNGSKHYKFTKMIRCTAADGIDPFPPFYFLVQATFPKILPRRSPAGRWRGRGLQPIIREIRKREKYIKRREAAWYRSGGRRMKRTD